MLSTSTSTLLLLSSLGLSATAMTLSPRDASPVDIATSFLTAYHNMDYPSLKALTTDDFVFEDGAYPHIQGEEARGMFRWFITDRANTNMNVTIVDVQPSTDDPDNQAIAQYIANYKFNGNPVINNINSTMTFTNGLLSLEQDHYSFPAWATQALGLVGPLVANLSATQTAIQAVAKLELDLFLMTHADPTAPSKRQTFPSISREA